MADSLPSDDQKLIFTVSVIVNFASGATDPYAAQQTIQSSLDSMQQYISKDGKWDMVWGPSVSVGVGASGELVSDNAMYVAKQENTNRYVIGIAGSNPNSPTDWIVEDDWVVGTQPWSKIIGESLPSSAGNPMIAPGTAVGLNNLLSTTPWFLLPGGLVKLTDFLAAESSKNPVYLSVCGHSLGGALAPTLALFLQNTKSQWDKNGSSTIMTMPVAGPTPGNNDFANYLSSTLTAAQVQGFYNSLDMVPHAWAPDDDNLIAIPKLYTPDIPENLGIDAIIAAALTASLLGAGPDNPYTPTARTELTGAINKDKISGQDSFADFMAQVAYQHTTAYVSFLAVPGTEDTVGSALAGAFPTLGNSISESAAAAIRKKGGTIPASVQVVPRQVIRRVQRAQRAK